MSFLLPESPKPISRDLSTASSVRVPTALVPVGLGSERLRVAADAVEASPKPMISATSTKMPANRGSLGPGMATGSSSADPTLV